MDKGNETWTVAKIIFGHRPLDNLLKISRCLPNQPQTQCLLRTSGLPALESWSPEATPRPGDWDPGSTPVGASQAGASGCNDAGRWGLQRRAFGWGGNARFLALEGPWLSSGRQGFFPGDLRPFSASILWKKVPRVFSILLQRGKQRLNSNPTPAHPPTAQSPIPGRQPPSLLTPVKDLWGGSQVSALAKLSQSVTWWGKVGDKMLRTHGPCTLASLSGGPGTRPASTRNREPRGPPTPSPHPALPTTAHGLQLSLWLTLSDSIPPGFSIPNHISKKAISILF